MSKHRRHEYNNATNYTGYNSGYNNGYNTSPNYNPPNLNGIINLLNNIDLNKLSSILSNIKLNQNNSQNVTSQQDTETETEKSEMDLNQNEHEESEINSHKSELINALKLILSTDKKELLETLIEMNK